MRKDSPSNTDAVVLQEHPAVFLSFRAACLAPGTHSNHLGPARSTHSSLWEALVSKIKSKYLLSRPTLLRDAELGFAGLALRLAIPDCPHPDGQGSSVQGNYPLLTER